jgi:hypothetical protein
MVLVPFLWSSWVPNYLRLGCERRDGEFDHKLPTTFRMLSFGWHLFVEKVKNVISEEDSYQPNVITSAQGYHRAS